MNRGFTRPLHWLAHYFGWNVGTIVSEWRGVHLWIGFRCAGCRATDWHQSAVNRKIA